MCLVSLILEINGNEFSTVQCSEGPIRCSFSNRKRIKIVIEDYFRIKPYRY